MRSALSSLPSSLSCAFFVYIIIFFLFQRYFMEGLTHTGIKG